MVSGKDFNAFFRAATWRNSFFLFFCHCWSSSHLQVMNEPRSALSDTKSVTSLRMSHEISNTTWILHCCLATFTHTGATLLSSLPPFLYSKKWVHTLNFALNYLVFGVSFNVCWTMHLRKQWWEELRVGRKHLNHQWGRHAYGNTRSKLLLSSSCHICLFRYRDPVSVYPPSFCIIQAVYLMQLYLRHYDARCLKLSHWIATIHQRRFALGTILTDAGWWWCTAARFKS